MTTQDSPIEHGHDDADDDQRLAGLLEQARADYLVGSHPEDAAASLHQRLDQAGIAVGDDTFELLLARVTA